MIDWEKHDNATCVSVTYFDSNGDTISTSWADRPTQKTVADAVEWHKSKGWGLSWASEGKDCITHGKLGFAFADSRNIQLDRKLVCTRAEFEAYVEEQEGEKWTHELWGDKAYIKIAEPDCDGYLMVVTEGDGYNLVKIEDLKPIKPTISKAEAWDKLLQTDERIRKLDEAIFAIADKYDII